MTMGPAPMMRIFLMSVRLGILFTGVDHVKKLFEQIPRVMRAGRCFRMVLNGKNRKFLMAQALAGMVIEIGVDHFGFGGVQTFCVHAKTMVLRRDTDALSFKVLDRMIGAVMAEFQFIRF